LEIGHEVSNQTSVIAQANIDSTYEERKHRLEALSPFPQGVLMLKRI